MRKNKEFLLPIALVVLAALVSGCGAKDLVSLAKLDAADLYVGDRYGNKAKIENAAEFLAALKSAKFVKNPQDARSEIEAEYIFYAGDNKVYYDTLGKYLIFVEKSKKSVYSADLGALLDGVQGLPLAFTPGAVDGEILDWLDELSHIDQPSALVFNQGDEAVLAVLAGQKPMTGYGLALEKVSYSAGEVSVEIRLTVPEEGCTVLAYPYETFTLSKRAKVNVKLIESGPGGDSTTYVPVSTVEEGQNIILLKPERGSILTEKVKMTGFARNFETSFLVEVEDGHNLLGTQQVTASKGDPSWGYFEFWIDLEPATSPYGSIIFVAHAGQGGVRAEELIVPVSFGGK